MRIIKLIVASILAFCLIITIISLFIPSHIRLSKAVQIYSPKQAVMDQVGKPENWRNWYPGADSSAFFYEHGQVRGLVLNDKKDQSIVLESQTADEIKAVYYLPGRHIGTGWQFFEANDSSSVTVQWYLDFQLRWYPWEKFTSFMFEKVYDPQLQEGLNKLKAIVEKNHG